VGKNLKEKGKEDRESPSLESLKGRGKKRGEKPQFPLFYISWEGEEGRKKEGKEKGLSLLFTS